MSEPAWRPTAEEIGKAYVEREASGDVADAYRKIVQVNETLFENIPIPVIFQEDDPYSSHDELCRRIEEEGKLRIFSGGEPPTHMSKEENLKGRAVHDYYGHYLENVDFTFPGEFAKWDSQRQHYPEECHGVLFTEVVAQLGAVHYLPEGYDSDRYIQKPIDAPQEWRDKARQAVQ